jgi:hypothetical protein
MTARTAIASAFKRSAIGQIVQAEHFSRKPAGLSN